MNVAERDTWIAYVGWADNNGSIWGHYNRLVDYLFESYPKTKRRFDEISIPFLHTISHGIELGLKENIAFFMEYSQTKNLTKFERLVDLEKSHELDKLADEFQIFYYRLHKQLGLDKDEKLEFVKYFDFLIDLIKILDRSAETYRYATKIDKDGKVLKASIDRQKKIDFLQVKALYEKVNILLIGAPNSIGRFTDFIDYQRANPKYLGGKGFLYCQRLHYTDWFHKKLVEDLDKKFTKIKDNLWYDSDTKENYEVQVFEDNMYIIAVDPRTR